MASCQITTQPQYQLTLTGEEARYLRDLLSDMSCQSFRNFLENRYLTPYANKLDATTREIHDALKDAFAGNP